MATFKFFSERQSCWAPLAHIPLVCFSHVDWAAFHLLHLFTACHPESLGGCKKSDQLLCIKNTSCPSRVCLLESIIAKCQQLERQKRGVTKVIIVTNRQWNCVSLNAKNTCGARTTNNSSMNCHCSRDSSLQGLHSCNWTWCFNWWILCSQCLVLHTCCTHSISLLTCQHRCSTSLVDFASCNVTLLTCWNTQCLLQLGVPHKVLDCIRCFGWEIRSLQNFARIDFKLISRPQYPLPKLSPPLVVTANYEQLLPTIWMV